MALGVALIAAAWRSARGGGGEPLVLALCMAASFAASPILWSHYYALLYVPIAIAAPRLRLIWLAPALLWPPADPASATWQIAVYLVAAAAVTAWVIVAAAALPQIAEGSHDRCDHSREVAEPGPGRRHRRPAAGGRRAGRAYAGHRVRRPQLRRLPHLLARRKRRAERAHAVPVRAASELRGQNQFVYPAPAAVAMAPFALLPLPASATLFLVLSIACVGASLWIAGVRDIRCFALAAGSLPVLQGVVMGTVTPILMLLLAIAWSKREHTRWIAGTAAAAVAIKLFVLPIGIWLVATGACARRSQLLIASVALLAAGWLLVGLHTATGYPHLLSSLTTVEGSYGYALYALVLRAGASATVAKLASVVAVGAWQRSSSAPAAGTTASGFALAVVACLACSPIVWNHYFALLIVAIAVLRPRLSWLWALAPAFWLIPNANHPAPTWKIVGAQLACARGRRRRGRDTRRTGALPTPSPSHRRQRSRCSASRTPR